MGARPYRLGTGGGGLSAPRAAHALGRAGVMLTAALLFLAVPAAASAVAPGDEPSTAIPVSAGTTQFDSTALTEGAADPASCGEFEDFTDTMWFSYTAERRGLAAFDVNSFVSPDGSTDFLAILFVYERAPDGTLAEIGCSAYPATVFTDLARGTTYLVAVAALDAEDTGEPELSDHGGTFALTIEPIRGRVLTDRFHDVLEPTVDEFWTEECGTEVTVTWNDRGAAKTFLDTSGERRFTFHIVGRTTLSSAEGSVTYSYANSFRDTFDGTFTSVGLGVKFVVDGEIVVMDRGRLVQDEEGNIVFEAGAHPTFEDGFDPCTELAG